MTPFDAWTDYPITEFGDTVGKPAPKRRCKVISCDRDKYVLIELDHPRPPSKILAKFTTEIKRWYVYSDQACTVQIKLP